MITDSSQFAPDVDGNGIYTPDSNADLLDPEGNDGPDILLTSDLMVDNYQVFEVAWVYFGFDLNGSGEVRVDNGRVYFDQRRFQMRADCC